MQKPAIVLAYLGLIPFVALPILALVGVLEYYRSYLMFVQYSAIILSFFGGIHWLDALQNRRKNHQLYVSMLPSIIAWLAIVSIDGNVLLSVLSVAYIAMLMYDKYVLALDKDIVIPYTVIRTVLTSVVVICHLIMAYL